MLIVLGVRPSFAEHDDSSQHEITLGSTEEFVGKLIHVGPVAVGRTERIASAVNR